MSNRTKDKSGWEKVRALLSSGQKPNWEQIEEELLRVKDPRADKEFRNKVRKAAGWQKIERLLEKGSDEERDSQLEKELAALPPLDPDERDQLGKMMKEELDRQACLQAVRSSGKGSPKVNPSFATISLYYELMPFDGSKSALAQMITAIRDMTMNCLERASNSELPPVRDLELNYATKGAIILSALTKTLDNHRLRVEQIETEKLKRLRSQGHEWRRKP